MKKCFSILLATALLISVFVMPANAVSNAGTETVSLFFENFDGYDSSATDEEKKAAMSQNSWNSTATNASFLTGTNLTVSRSAEQVYISTKNDISKDWTDYSVSADIKFTFEDENLINDVFSGIAARCSDRTKGGYELQLFIHKAGVDSDQNPTPQTTGLRIIKREDTDLGVATTVLASKSFAICSETVYRITLKVKGVIIEAYVDGVLILSTADDSFISGAAGLRSAARNTGAEVSYDNFEVSYVPEAVFEDDFSYSGETANIYKEMLANGWEINKNQCSYIDQENNELSLPASNVYLTTKGASGALAWNDYTVSADVFIGEGIIESNKSIYAGIAGRITSKAVTGYEFALFAKANSSGDVTNGVRLYKRESLNGVVTKTALKEVTSTLIKQGYTYNLAMTFVGNSIYCYLDNELVIFSQDDSYSYGYAGIRTFVTSTSFDSSVTFDNFKVYLPENPYVDTTKNAYFADGFFGYNGDNSTALANSVRANNWMLHANSTAGFCTDGKFVVNGNYGNMFNNNYIGSDYSVEADVSINNMDAGGNIYSAIVGRVNPDVEKPYAYSGYEFAIANVRGVGKARLYRRDSSEQSVEKTTINQIDFIIEAGKSYRLKMNFSRDTICCYIDGVKVIEGTDTAYTTGGAGIRTTNANATYSCSFDNFAVINENYVKENIGCITGGNRVTSADLVTLSQVLLGTVSETSLCDVNKDSAVNILDLVRIKKIVVSYK